MDKKEVIKELQNMKAFNYTLAPTEVFDMAIEALQDRPTGKWIYVTVEEWLRTGRDYGHHCSECDEINECGKSNFCPYCGARMRGDEE